MRITTRRQIGDLSAEHRHWVEQVLGVALSGDDELCILVHRKQHPADDATRSAARERLDAIMDCAGTNVAASGLSDEAVDQVIDEACDAVRREHRA